MKKLLLVSVTLILSIQEAYAEQCKGCDFSTSSILLVLAGIAFGAIAIAFITSIVVYNILNKFVTQKRKNVWPTFVGAIFGGVIGVNNIFRLTISQNSLLQAVIFFGICGALFGYFFTEKIITGNDGESQ